MEKYKRLYLKLFNGLSDKIEELQQLQRELEEEYIKLCENDKEADE